MTLIPFYRFFQGFYLYLYLVSVGFVVTMYTILLRDRAVKKVLVRNDKREGTLFHDEYGPRRRSFQVINQTNFIYGSL